jgi:hypothetical protein
MYTVQNMPPRPPVGRHGFKEGIYTSISQSEENAESSHDALRSITIIVTGFSSLAQKRTSLEIFAESFSKVSIQKAALPISVQRMPPLDL